VTKLHPTGSALVYSTYLGGSDSDLGLGIAVDSLGNAYVTGEARSANFPTTSGAWQTASGGGDDAFVTKLNPTGSALVYSTYLGGNSSDRALGIALNTLGDAYVTGSTRSTNFPTTLGAFRTAFGGGQNDAFVTMLYRTGTTIGYSTYLGGNDEDVGRGIAVDYLGSAYVTGFTWASTNFPTTPGAFQTAVHPGGPDAFVTKLNPFGTALVYSTYLGGNDFDFALGIGLDTLGNAYVTGATTSTNFPTTPGAFQTAFGGLDAFVTKLNPTGSALIYSTRLGGSQFEEGRGIAVDTFGNAYVTGATGSTNFPTTPGAFQTSSGGGGDAFVTKLNPTGSALVYSTYLGGRKDDDIDNISRGVVAGGIALDSLGNAYVTGDTRSNNFPATPGAFQTRYGGSVDGFVAKIRFGATGYEIVSNRVLLPPSSAGNVNVTCSTGNKVLGGGLSIETPAFIKVFSSEPSDGFSNFSDHSWNVFAQNTDPTNTRQVTAIAVCASRSLLPGYEIVTNQVFVPASSSATVNVACSTGNKVLGGGFNIETPDFINVISSEPSDGLGNLSDRMWNVAAQNTDPNNALQVQASAVCASPGLLPGYQIVSNQVMLPASSAGNVNVTCSAGKNVLGGGFALGHSVFVKLVHSYPLNDRSWDVFAQNTDPNNAWPAWVTAVCAAAGP